MRLRMLAVVAASRHPTPITRNCRHAAHTNHEQRLERVEARDWPGVPRAQRSGARVRRHDSDAQKDGRRVAARASGRHVDDGVVRHVDGGEAVRVVEAVVVERVEVDGLGVRNNVDVQRHGCGRRWVATDARVRAATRVDGYRDRSDAHRGVELHGAEKAICVRHRTRDGAVNGHAH